MKTTMIIEKSKWFPSEYKADIHAVVLIAPGLNLLPSKMDQLAHFLASKKCDVLRISLGNKPDLWTETFSDAYDEALEHAEILQRPLYFLGFSLGALLGVHYLIRHPHHKFQKAILLAPATHTNLWNLIPAFLGNFFPKLKIPSLNLPNYRQSSSTTLFEYKKIYDLQNQIKNNLKNDKNEINIPTLLIFNSQDELVDTHKLSKFAGLNPMWRTLKLTNYDSLLPRKYHHLIIDSEAIGAEGWEKVLKSLTGHLSL